MLLTLLHWPQTKAFSLQVPDPDEVCRESPPTFSRPLNSHLEMDQGLWELTIKNNFRDFWGPW